MFSRTIVVDRKQKILSTIIASLLVFCVFASPVLANTVETSTIVFEGTLVDNGDGTYTGVIPAVVDGEYDIYAKEGDSAWFGNDPGTGPEWTEQVISSHDAWPTWTPDTPDWYQYSLELNGDTWSIRNHAGATEENPWYNDPETFPARGVPMSGVMLWEYSYAVETDVGAYLSGMGVSEIPDGAAGQGGGSYTWDMDWSWGSEVVPLEYAGFDVTIEDLGGGDYRVTFAPSAPSDVYVDDDGECGSYPCYTTIQEGIDAVAEGGTVYVSPGTYDERIFIDKPLTLRGATYNVNKNGYDVPDGYAWDDSVETIITNPDPSGDYSAIVDIVDTDDVTFEGFIVQELNAVGNSVDSLLRVYAHTKEISNIVVRNNVIGPFTNTVEQDGTEGRMGLYIVNHPYSSEYGVVDSVFSGNKIFDCKGNGNNVFIWSSYYDYGASSPTSMSGTMIEDNEIYGAHRSGIETAGGYSELVIQNNKIYDNGGSTIEGKPEIMFGNGILLIRGSGDRSTCDGLGPEILTIENNEIYNNQRNAIYIWDRKMMK